MKFAFLCFVMVHQVTVLSASVKSEKTLSSSENHETALTILSCFEFQGNTSSLLESSPDLTASHQFRNLIPHQLLPKSLLNSLSKCNCSCTSRINLNGLQKPVYDHILVFLLKIPTSEMCVCIVKDISYDNIAQNNMPTFLLHWQNLNVTLLFQKNERKENIVIKVYVQDRHSISLCLKCNTTLLKVFSSILKHHSHSPLFKYIPNLLQSKVKPSQFSKEVPIRLKTFLKKLTLCRHINILEKTLYRNIDVGTNLRWKRNANETKPDHNTTAAKVHTQQVASSTRDHQSSSESDGNNSTDLLEFYKKALLRKQLDRDSESAAMCIVFLTCLMLFFLWYLRGFHNRNTKYREMNFHDKSHILTVEEVLFRKRHYLPMFNQEHEFEEVLVRDYGTDP